MNRSLIVRGVYQLTFNERNLAVDSACIGLNAAKKSP
jgi:hypothetical protein